jgi:glycosyltransferase involved in cell wall biosynthesis
MKLGFISEHYPPTAGGVATSTQRVANELSKKGIEVHVICFDTVQPLTSEDFILEETDGKVKVYRIGPFFLKQKKIDIGDIPQKIKATFRRRVYNQLVAILKEVQVDCLLSFYLLNAGYLALFASRELDVPFIAGIRGNDIGRNIFNTQRFSVIKHVVTGANSLVCVNEHLKKRMLIAFPEVKEKTSVIPNGIEPFDLPKKEFSKSKILKATGWTKEDLIVVFSGSLREKKGAVPLINAMRLCGYKYPVKLLVVGPDIGNIEKRMCGDLWDRLKTDNLIYTTGQIPRNKVRDWVTGGDVIVMPSLDDGMANGLLEGMFMGLCPVVSEVFSDLVEPNETGIMLPSNGNNPKSIAEAFIRLSTDKNKTDKIGINARAFIEEYHKPESEADKYSKIFTRLVNNE